MFVKSLNRDRKPRRPRRAALEMLEVRRMPSASGVGHLLNRASAHVATAQPPSPAEVSTLDVPLKLVEVKGKGRRLSVDVTVAGVTRPYLLDTGSSGMYVARYGLNRSDYRPTRTPFVQKYSSHIRYVGRVMTTDLSFPVPGSPTASGVLVGMIEKAEHIPHWGRRLRQGRPPYEKFYGTLGMSLVPGDSKKGDLYSIIAQLPGNLSSGFIVHASNTEGQKPQLTIGLNAENTRGFSTVPMPAANGTSRATPYVNGNGAKNKVLAWNDKGVGVGYLIGGMPLFSASTVFDTGNPTTTLYTGNVPNSLRNGGLLENGLPFRAGLAPGATWGFTTGTKVNVDRVYVAGQTRGTVNTGIGLFFHYDVMYDLAHGVIGFRPVSAGAN